MEDGRPMTGDDLDDFWAQEEKAKRTDEAEALWMLRKDVREHKAKGVLGFEYEGGRDFVALVKELLGEMCEANLSPSQMGWIGANGQP